ncbi:Conjugal transfer protein traG [uncultured Flavonifractor sp.]|nr:plasmid transfer factor TraK [Flavonifractor plautii]SCJ23844.1 Conjugal transfer protein traG [uncultured Flavonifractor sp.]
MFRLSEKLAHLEDRILSRWGKKIERFFDRCKGKWKLYIPLVLCGWYFYGMFINSVHLGIQSTFNTTGEPVGSIWVVNPFRNLLAVFTPTGLGVTAACVILFCLITKKGYLWFSGYKFIRDKRGFDILPDGTHGTSGFMSRKEQEKILLTAPISELSGTLLGKLKDDPDDDDKYAEYVTLRPNSGLTEHIMVYGATGAGKTRGFVKPFILQCAARRSGKESLICVDPKGEVYESMSSLLLEQGYEVKMFNLLDMENSDAWNCLSGIEKDKDLVQSIAEVIIKNTSNANERQDFWEKAELNLLMALMHYVATQTVPGTGELLPIQQRSLGAIYRLLSNESFADLERRFDDLPRGHPALAPYGIFKLANRQIWGNIAIGLGNRLSVFQNPLVDKITSYNEIDLTLPGTKPCAYFCCISAQDSSLEFLSSLFFSQLFARLIEYGRRHGNHGRLPMTVNVCLEEFCNIGKLPDFKRVLNFCRGSGIFCQLIVQSIPQLQDRYPKTEWEELIGCTDIQICLGCNDVDTATYISKKCGMVTIKVENNQMPLQPLFSPVYNSTRPYSQTKSSTQRALMLPDEIMRMDNRECLVLLRGQKPLKLYKITPDEHPSFSRLRDVKVADYTPEWRRFEVSPKPTAPAPEPKPAPPPPAPKPEGRDAGPKPKPAARPQPESSGTSIRQEYDYGLLDVELDGLPTQQPDTGAPYGALDLIETSPEDVGGP